MKNMWEQRYAADEYAYGEEPNAFFKACLDRLPTPGRILLPAEGEGRNAVYAAQRGWEVDAFDFSAAGREKALRLAERHGVQINYELADYETAHIEPEAYDAVALIFAHKHESIRTKVHRKLAWALKPGGHLFLEAYSKEQIGYGTGGPPTKQLLLWKEGASVDPSIHRVRLIRTASGLRSSRRGLEAKLGEQHVRQISQSSSIRVCASRLGEHHPSIRASGGHCIDRYSEGA